MSAHKALKLRAEDDEDLGIIAACLRGAIGCLNEMAYDREARRFAAILVRTEWEAAPAEAGARRDSALGRRRAGLHFDHVNAVRYRHLDLSAPRTLLQLVSIVSAPLSERFAIILSFEGGGEVFLEVDKLHGQMRDLDGASKDTAQAGA